MGTFLGHVIPGTFFFIYGVFYIIRDALSTAKYVENADILPKRRLQRPPTDRRNDAAGSEGDSSGSESDAGGEEHTLFSQTNVPIPLKSLRMSQANDASTSSGSDASSPREKTPRRRHFSESSAERRTSTRRRGNAQKGCLRWKTCLTNVTVIEGIVKILCAVFGALGELWWVDWYMINPRTGNFTNMNNWQHATMFLFFALSGIADVILQTCLNDAQKEVPKCEKIFLSLAFWVEFILFYFHYQGRRESNVHIHTLLMCAVAVCAAASALEPWCSRLHTDRQIGIRRIWVIAMCLQGTWFWQIAFVIYNPWKPSTSGDDLTSTWQGVEANMMLTTMFVWHLIGVMLMTFNVHWIVRYCSRMRCCTVK